MLEERVGADERLVVTELRVGTEPRCVVAELRCVVAELRVVVAVLRCVVAELRCVGAEPRCTLADVRLLELGRTAVATCDVRAPAPRFIAAWRVDPAEVRRTPRLPKVLSILPAVR